MLDFGLARPDAHPAVRFLAGPRFADAAVGLTQAEGHAYRAQVRRLLDEEAAAGPPPS